MGTLTIVICSQEAHQTYEFFSWENIEFIYLSLPFFYMQRFICNMPAHSAFQFQRKYKRNKKKNNLFRIQMAGEVTLTSQDGQEISKYR